MQKHIIPNLHGWALLLDFLSKERTLYKIEVIDKRYYSVSSKKELSTVRKVLEEVFRNPERIVDYLAQIPQELKEEYFPSQATCSYEEDVEMIYEELPLDSEIAFFYRRTTGSKVEFVVDLKVEDLFNQYNDLFETFDQYANGYGWHELIIKNLYPSKEDDIMQRKYPKFDPSASDLTIEFKRKKDSLQFVSDFQGMISSTENLRVALKKNQR